MNFRDYFNPKDFALLLAVLWGAACAQPEGASPPAEARPAADAYALPFARPAAALALPSALTEISGLVALDASSIAAIQDEVGIIFVLDAATGRITARHRFGKDGDYEDLARVDDRLYVLRSDGRIYELIAWRSEKPQVEVFKNTFDHVCDAEGLAYEAPRGRLLIACKEGANRSQQPVRAIYAFDLATRQLQAEPAFSILLADLAPLLRVRPEGVLDRAAHVLRHGVQEEMGFKPSALRVHPETGALWVLSSVTQAIVVLDREGRLQTAYLLPPGLFEQPEAMDFLPDGSLLVASEGKAGAASLVRFDKAVSNP